MVNPHDTIRIVKRKGDVEYDKLIEFVREQKIVDWNEFYAFYVEELLSRDENADKTEDDVCTPLS